MSGASLMPDALEGAILCAAVEGYEVVTADERTLLLDLDTNESLAQYDRVLPVVDEHFGISKIDRWPSKGGNTHIALTLSLPQPAAVRYALQAALGSDGVREALILVQQRNGCAEPSILFKPTSATAAVLAGTS